MLIIMYNLNHFYKLTLFIHLFISVVCYRKIVFHWYNDYPNRNEPRNDRDACKSDVVVGLKTFGMLP